MKLYCPHCHLPLLIKHTIELELSSEFDYKAEIITLTNHHINSSKRTDAFIKTEDVNNFYCMDCGNDSILKDSMFRCDDCGGIYEHKSSQPVGESLIICKSCLNGNKTLDFFKIFGKRGPSKTKREDRTREAIGEAGIEVPAEQLLEELDRFNADELGNIVQPIVADLPVDLVGNIEDDVFLENPDIVEEDVEREVQLEMERVDREREARDRRLNDQIREEREGNV